MKVLSTVFTLCVLFSRVHHVFTVGYDDMKTELANVLDTFFDASSLRPVTDSSNTGIVSIDWNLVSILDFDETNGYLEVSGYLSLEWTAEALTASTFDLNIMVQETKIWRPPLVLVNSLDGTDLIGYDSSVKVRVNVMSKICQWRPWTVARVACKADVTYYPYDRQECSLLFSVWGYNTTEVTLQINNPNEWSTLYFEENGEWEIVETSSELSTVQDSSTVDFKIKLSRRPLFYVINIVAPIVLLGLVNVCTFYLPIESGERVGFSVTCFLSYVVLLNMVMSLLPSSASPMSYLSYYTFVMMVFSALMSIMTIVTLRIYHKSDDDGVPYCIAAFYLLLTCKICQTGSSNRVRTISVSSASISEESVSQNSSKRIEVKDVKWKNIADFIDAFLFFGFLILQIFYSVAYLLPVFLSS
ncbi:behavioral response to nicotine [Mactra antiquata]